MEKGRNTKFSKEKQLFFFFLVGLWRPFWKTKERLIDVAIHVSHFTPLGAVVNIHTDLSIKKTQEKKCKPKNTTRTNQVFHQSKNNQTKKTTLGTKGNQRRQADFLFSIRHIYCLCALCGTGLICLRRGLGVLPQRECKWKLLTRALAEMCVRGCPGSEKQLCAQESTLGEIMSLTGRQRISYLSPEKKQFRWFFFTKKILKSPYDSIFCGTAFCCHNSSKFSGECFFFAHSSLQSSSSLVRFNGGRLWTAISNLATDSRWDLGLDFDWGNLTHEYVLF